MSSLVDLLGRLDMPTNGMADAYVFLTKALRDAIGPDKFGAGAPGGRRLAESNSLASE